MEKKESTSDEQSLDAAIQPLQDLFARQQEEDVVEVEAAAPTETADTTSVETTSQTSDTETEVNQADESVDDTDVPIKNRLMEAIRKNAKLEERLNALESKQEEITSRQTPELDIASSFRIGQVNQQQPMQQTNQSAGTDVNAEPQFATRQEVLALNQMLAAKNALDTEALKRFPELYDKSSSLHKETKAIIDSKLRRGTNNLDPALFIESAQAAYGKLVSEGKLKPTVRVRDEQNRRQSVDSTTVPVTRKSTVSSKDQNKKSLSEMERRVLNTFRRMGVKMTEDEYLKGRR